MQQYTPNLGHLCDESAFRDAIHIAVAPVRVGQKLQPGDRVGFNIDGLVVKESDQAKQIGIIDPFLSEPVKTLQHCWLFLFPNTVTSLRHVWHHPAFKTKLPENLA